MHKEALHCTSYVDALPRLIDDRRVTGVFTLSPRGEWSIELSANEATARGGNWRYWLSITADGVGAGLQAGENDGSLPVV